VFVALGDGTFGFTPEFDTGALQPPFIDSRQ
jgi:hypothetical protein